MIEEEYISLETVKLAEGKGIFLTDAMVCDGVLVFGRRFIDVPSQTVLARWLREKHHLFVTAGYCVAWRYVIVPVTDKITCIFETSKETYSSYEKALEAGLQEALNLIESEVAK
jgi:hypothetical protein